MKEVDSKEYSEEYFLSINHGWMDFSTGKLSDFYLKALSFSGLKNLKGKKILDIGFGRGELLVHCSLLGSESHGVDYSSAGVKMASDYALKKKAKIFLQKKDVKEMKFPENYFDAIFMLDIIEHLTPEQLSIAFSKAYKYLKPEGVLVIHTMPNKFLAVPFYFVSKLLGVKRGYNEHVHINEQTPFSLSSELSKIGFKTKIKLCHDKTYFKNTNFYAQKKKIIKFFVDIFLVHDFSKIPFFNNFLASEIWAIASKK